MSRRCLCWLEVDLLSIPPFSKKVKGWTIRQVPAPGKEMTASVKRSSLSLAMWQKSRNPKSWASPLIKHDSVEHRVHHGPSMMVSSTSLNYPPLNHDYGRKGEPKILCLSSLFNVTLLDVNVRRRLYHLSDCTWITDCWLHHQELMKLPYPNTEHTTVRCLEYGVLAFEESRFTNEGTKI